MTLSRHTSKVYMDEYDLDGTLNALGKRIEEGDESLPYYIGAHIALNIIRNHEYIDTQREFMQLFDRVMDRKDGSICRS